MGGGSSSYRREDDSEFGDIDDYRHRRNQNAALIEQNKMLNEILKQNETKRANEYERDGERRAHTPARIVGSSTELEAVAKILAVHEQMLRSENDYSKELTKARLALTPSDRIDALRDARTRAMKLLDQQSQLIAHAEREGERVAFADLSADRNTTLSILTKLNTSPVAFAIQAQSNSHVNAMMQR